MTATTPFAELCPGCFTEKGNANPCPHCAYDESLKRGPLLLPHRSLLNQGQYLIGKVLGKPGGFGITYLAFDTKLETRVAIKEYLPRDLAGRDGNHATISAHSEEDGEFFRFGLTQFLQEARTLAKFDHANIVRVRNFFEENGTGYLVMDYYDGVTLADYLTQQPQGKLPESTAVGILMPILDGLREVHAKHFLHRDIKPQNIYLTTGNRAILLDFGAARQAMGERSRSLSVVLSEGYAPYEQYHRRGEQGPWTDIYACAAVLYHAVAGQAPPPATERVHEDELEFASLGVSASLAEALRQGLAVDHKQRPQRMEAFQGLLLGSGAAGLAEGVEPKPVQAERSTPVNPVVPNTIKPTPGKMSQRAKVGLGAVTVLAIVISVGAMLTREKDATLPATVAPVVAAPASAKQPNKEPAADAPAPLVAKAEMTPGQVFKDCADCPAMVVLPPGKFLMGSSATERAALVKVGMPKEFADLESPQHEVRIDYPFAVGQVEVSRGEFRRFVAASGYRTDAEREDGCYVLKANASDFDFELKGDADWRNPGFAQTDQHPVVCVSWNDAQAYVKWLRGKTQQAYRLLSEAEWEYAARAGSRGRWSFGNDERQLSGHAWYGDNSDYKTHPGAQKKANAFGLYDMHGNALEWVEDCWHDNYKDAPSDGSAWISRCQVARGLRGGSWFDLAWGSRAAFRNLSSPGGRGSYFDGFRLARTF